jgi:hypothetical protein
MQSAPKTLIDAQEKPSVLRHSWSLFQWATREVACLLPELFVFKQALRGLCGVYFDMSIAANFLIAWGKILCLFGMHGKCCLA